MRRRSKAGWGKFALGAGLLLLALLLGAACEYPGVAHPLAAEVSQPAQSSPQAPAPATPTPPTADQGQPPAPPSPGTAVPKGPIQVALKDFRLEPDQVTAKAGKVTFLLKNEGRYTHDFRVEGQGVDSKAPKVGVGRTGEWPVTLAPGEYRISCPISNHADRGMVGKMAVVP